VTGWVGGVGPRDACGHPSGPQGTRYPFSDLERLLGWPATDEMAARFDTTTGNVNVWRRRGLSHKQADAVACMADLHPTLVWSDWQ
jgi:hypothetical protein